MSGGGINVYFGGDCQKIIERMEKGELSKVCQKAVRAWDISSDDVIVLENQEAELEEEKRKINVKIATIDKKIDAIATKDNQEFKKKFEESEKIKKDLESNKRTIKKEFIRIARSECLRNEETAERYFKLYWEVRLNGRNPEMGKFIRQTAYKEQNPGEYEDVTK